MLCGWNLRLYNKVVLITICLNVPNTTTTTTSSSSHPPPGAELSVIAESFVLLNDLLLPFLSILDASCPIFDLHLANACLMLSSHLYLGLPCDLLVRCFQLNIFLSVLVSDILCT